MQRLLIGLRRFAKGFIAGGLAQTALIISGGLTIRNLDDIQAVGLILLSGFITGGLLALQKMLSYEPSA